MPTLKEIKGRITSVQSTLKITSAMKLVASSKLRRAQQAIEGMRPYQQMLLRMQQQVLSALAGSEPVAASPFASVRTPLDEEGRERPLRVALVAIASNSSLCGGFNANAVRLVLETLSSYGDADVTVYSIGRKMADALRKAGHPSPKDFTALADKPSYAPAADLTQELMDGFLSGKYDRVELVYNHFVSSAKQVPVRETLLPAGTAASPDGTPSAEAVDFILEPSAGQLLDELLPKTLKLQLYTALLDSAAAEHAARTVAMQTATDNGEDLLSELTLQYNKSRQQKITSEILDLAGGALQ